MKPVCVPCQRFFRCTKNGYYFIEAMPDPESPTAKPKPGTVEPESWIPYKIWVGDKWTCEGCGTQIISGVGSAAHAEHYQPGFAETVARLHADQLQVNDC